MHILVLILLTALRLTQAHQFQRIFVERIVSLLQFEIFIISKLHRKSRQFRRLGLAKVLFFQLNSSFSLCSSLLYSFLSFPFSLSSFSKFPKKSRNLRIIWNLFRYFLLRYLNFHTAICFQPITCTHKIYFNVCTPMIRTYLSRFFSSSFFVIFAIYFFFSTLGFRRTYSFALLIYFLCVFHLVIKCSHFLLRNLALNISLDFFFFTPVCCFGAINNS